ncbi:MAG: hypothetical protein FWH22_01525, partial [Fibromonadales bacterium]|nr:hypothetical protein [Fibromonadales bacterium]
MLIANPIYDVTFKRLLENNRVAKFLIGTILGCDVLSLVPGTPEFTDTKDDSDKLTLFQMDFTATIATKEEGEKLVIIEMQKARDLADVYRFKRYLGKQYTKSKLPIISIYILGFDLKSVDSPAFAAIPDCRDLTTNEKLAIRHSFVSQLTHRAYFIQTKKIKPSLNTRLEKLLSIFEQANFVGDGEKIKDYHLAIDDPEIKELLGVLSYV